MYSIVVLENNLKINKKTALELMQISRKLETTDEGVWYDLEDVTDHKGCITFNSDHYEHMDFLGNNQAIVKCLKTNKVKGTVTFGCLDGDQRGEFWGYKFDGKGGMRFLKGTLVWKEK